MISTVMVLVMVVIAAMFFTLIDWVFSLGVKLILGA